MSYSIISPKLLALQRALLGCSARSHGAPSLGACSAGLNPLPSCVFARSMPCFPALSLYGHAFVLPGPLPNRANACDREASKPTLPLISTLAAVAFAAALALAAVAFAAALALVAAASPLLWPSR